MPRMHVRGARGRTSFLQVTSHTRTLLPSLSFRLIAFVICLI